MRWRVEGGPLAPFLPRKLSHLYCFLFGHDVPCGTGGGLCQRCYKVMSLCRDKHGYFTELNSLRNSCSISLRDFYDFFWIRAKYKFWVKTW